MKAEKDNKEHLILLLLLPYPSKLNAEQSRVYYICVLLESHQVEMDVDLLNVFGSNCLMTQRSLNVLPDAVKQSSFSLCAYLDIFNLDLRP